MHSTEFAPSGLSFKHDFPFGAASLWDSLLKGGILPPDLWCRLAPSGRENQTSANRLNPGRRQQKESHV